VGQSFRHSAVIKEELERALFMQLLQQDVLLV